jgi:hypothetical protein
MRASGVPDGVPMLTRGRHRSSRRGASFMEYASFLAGEPWSDHPACTHPMLAQLARHINEVVDDADRQELAELVPDVVGRRGDDHTWLTLPVAVASTAILEAPNSTQHVLATGLLRAEQLCEQAGHHLIATEHAARQALELVPAATHWAEQFLAGVGSRITPRTFVNQCAPTMLRNAVDGVVMTGHPDRAARLRTLLQVAIVACPVPVTTTGP